MSEEVCSVYGTILDDTEFDICDNCKASILCNEDIEPSF